ncbi:hypothetical protein LUZ61_005199 [Rhynchospora tenuis]|uniref:DUF7032 domain-containing protein n=1 Tax=Rhynchospora tenuis TaxID=198213 RepID=A0AAD5ZP51_9POAL|nr:hypothetical protein LUZ61_005199 [Rhynchospora tenuis]
MKSPDQPVVSPTGEDEVRELHHRCLALLSSLPSPPATSLLRRKWPSISTSCTRLLSTLPSLPLSNPLSLPLLSSLSTSLSHLHSLSSSPPAGKLQLQSELSSLATTLLGLVSDADLLVSTGGGSSENDLVSRLQVGPISSRLEALDLLLSDKTTMSASSVQSVVPSLLKLLEPSASFEAREKATLAFAKLSLSESSRHVITSSEVSSSLVIHLSRVLDSATGGTTAIENACTILQTLTIVKENAIALASRGGVGPLLEICHAGTPSAQASAAAVLKNLAQVETIRPYFVDENGIPTLINLSYIGTPVAKDNAIGCLCNLAGPSEDELQDLKITLFKEGALDCIKSYLELQVQEDRDWNLEGAIGLLRHLSSFRYIAEIVTNNGFVPYVVSALDSTKPRVRIEAARTIAELAVTGRIVNEICDSIPKLVRMLEGKGSEEREASAKALANLMQVSGYRRIFRKDEGGIVNVVQLLDPLADVEKKYAISVLLSLSQSRKCRKQMVAAGACGYLRGNLAMQVEEAKKLLECLGRGRILGVFPRV